MARASGGGEGPESGLSSLPKLVSAELRLYRRAVFSGLFPGKHSSPCWDREKPDGMAEEPT